MSQGLKIPGSNPRGFLICIIETSLSYCQAQSSGLDGHNFRSPVGLTAWMNAKIIL